MNTENNNYDYICSECGTSISVQDKVCTKCGANLNSLAEDNEEEKIKSKETKNIGSMILHSFFMGSLVGIIVDIFIILVHFIFAFRAFVKGIPVSFSPFEGIGAIEVYVVVFLIFCFSAGSIKYNILLKESGNISSSSYEKHFFLMYFISSILAFILVMYMGRDSEIGSAVFLSIIMAIILPGIAAILLVKVTDIIKKLTKTSREC